MTYRVLADGIFLLHLGFILFVVFGALLLTRFPRLRYAHLAALAWAIFIESSGGICPLTPLENHYRQLAGEAGYAGGFVEHYLLPVVYPADLTRPLQWALAAFIFALNAWLYWRWYRRR